MLKVAGGGVATGTLSYQGTWNANTNTPTLTSSVGTINNYYVVSVAGTTNLNGITDWQVNDWAIFNGSVWQKIDQSDLVTSVNGQTGAVSLVVGDIPGAVPNTVNVLTSGLASGGGPLTGNVTITVNDIPVANVTGAVPNTRTVSAGGLLSGGGNLASNVTISLTDVPLANVTGLGTMATQNANAVTITGGTINAVTFYTANIQNVAVTFPNSFLANSSVTIGNTSVSLGGTQSTFGNVTLQNVTISNVASTFPNSFLSNSSTTLGNATLTLGGTTTSVGNLTLSNANITSVAQTFPNSYLANSAVTIGNTSVSLGGTVSSIGNLTLTNVTISSGSVAINVANVTSNTNSNATMSTASLPLVPAGYFNVNLNGTQVKVPYYAV